MRAPDELAGVQALRDRNRLLSLVRKMFAGHRLEIRDRHERVVITNPADPDRGRVYINYVTGEMSWYRPVWTYFGHLKGYAQASEADPDTEPVADAETILRALCGPDEDGAP